MRFVLKEVSKASARPFVFLQSAGQQQVHGSGVVQSYVLNAVLLWKSCGRPRGHAKSNSLVPLIYCVPQHGCKRSQSAAWGADITAHYRRARLQLGRVSRVAVLALWHCRGHCSFAALLGGYCSAIATGRCHSVALVCEVVRVFCCCRRMHGLETWAASHISPPAPSASTWGLPPPQAAEFATQPGATTAIGTSWQLSQRAMLCMFCPFQGISMHCKGS